MAPGLSGGASTGTPQQGSPANAPAGTRTQLFREYNDPPQFVCTEETCGKRFGRKEHLARHMRARTPPHSPAPTIDCDRIANRLVDANDKPYKCPEEGCEADFTRSDLLKRYHLPVVVVIEC
jgi:uncharacterized Zn-finger protein